MTSPDVPARVRVECQADRVMVYVTRRQARCFSLSLAEAHQLWTELGALDLAAAAVAAGSAPAGRTA